MIRSIEDQLRDAREETESGYAVVHIDTCLPSYLQDHHNRDGEFLLGVYVTGKSTVGEVLHGLAMELNESCYLEDGERGGFVYDKASAAVAALREENKDRLEAIFDPGLEPMTDEEFEDADEIPQAWFLITWDVPEEEEEETS